MTIFRSWFNAFHNHSPYSWRNTATKTPLVLAVVIHTIPTGFIVLSYHFTKSAGLKGRFKMTMAKHKIGFMNIMVIGMICLSRSTSIGVEGDRRDQTEPAEPHWELFLDNQSITRSTGFCRVIHRPRSRGSCWKAPRIGKKGALRRYTSVGAKMAVWNVIIGHTDPTETSPVMPSAKMAFTGKNLC